MERLPSIVTSRKYKLLIRMLVALLAALGEKPLNIAKYNFL